MLISDSLCSAKYEFEKLYSSAKSKLIKRGNKHSLWNVKNCIISISLEYVHINLVQLYKNIKSANRIRTHNPQALYGIKIQNFKQSEKHIKLGHLDHGLIILKASTEEKWMHVCGRSMLWILWVSTPYPQIHILIWNSDKLPKIKLNMKILL